MDGMAVPRLRCQQHERVHPVRPCLCAEAVDLGRRSLCRRLLLDVLYLCPAVLVHELHRVHALQHALVARCEACAGTPRPDPFLVQASGISRLDPRGVHLLRSHRRGWSPSRSRHVVRHLISRRVPAGPMGAWPTRRTLHLAREWLGCAVPPACSGLRDVQGRLPTVEDRCELHAAVQVGLVALRAGTGGGILRWRFLPIPAICGAAQQGGVPGQAGAMPRPPRGREPGKMEAHGETGSPE
mmetsp:Transcript_61615/g.198440  ORF Transcript_61615/g.198440 Transcript_61615/m.198440 type:complete len:241 (+) Transcript_61615:384-1106(+)